MIFRLCLPLVLGVSFFAASAAHEQNPEPSMPPKVFEDKHGWTSSGRVSLTVFCDPKRLRPAFILPSRSVTPWPIPFPLGLRSRSAGAL